MALCRHGKCRREMFHLAWCALWVPGCLHQIHHGLTTDLPDVTAAGTFYCWLLASMRRAVIAFTLRMDDACWAPSEWTWGKLASTAFCFNDSSELLDIAGRTMCCWPLAYRERAIKAVRCFTLWMMVELQVHWQELASILFSDDSTIDSSDVAADGTMYCWLLAHMRRTIIATKLLSFEWTTLNEL